MLAFTHKLCVEEAEAPLAFKISIAEFSRPFMDQRVPMGCPVFMPFESTDVSDTMRMTQAIKQQGNRAFGSRCRITLQRP